jgi:hypothetical protein
MKAVLLDWRLQHLSTETVVNGPRSWFAEPALVKKKLAPAPAYAPNVNVELVCVGAPAILEPAYAVAPPDPNNPPEFPEPLL